MRTQPARILPGCPWCNEDHNPDIECRFKPVSSRFHLNGPRPPRRVEIERTTDATGKLIAVKVIRHV